MVKIKIIAESRSPGVLKKRKKSRNKAKARRLSYKKPELPKSRYMKIMQKIEPTIKKLPKGKTLYAAMTATETIKGAYGALKKEAHKLGYKGIIEAFNEEKYWPNTQFRMILALLKWFKDEGFLDMIPGVSELSWANEMNLRYNVMLNYRTKHMYNPKNNPFISPFGGLR